MDIEETGTFDKRPKQFDNLPPMPVVLVAHAPPKTLRSEGSVIDGAVEIGRGQDCGFRILETNISRRHLRITCDQKGNWIEDLESKNGTFVNGRRIIGVVELPDHAVVRIGMVVLVFLADMNDILAPKQTNDFGIVGRFYGTIIIDSLLECITSSRNLMIVGPSGSGKELAARAVAEMMKLPIIVQNAADFASEEEAMSSLFGVGGNVEQRPGCIEKADNGVLFLDQIHKLPMTVQENLLRVLEDNQVARIGEKETKKLNVQFVFTSDEPPPTYGLTETLVARLMMFRVPSLKERLADIPSIFDHLLLGALDRVGVRKLKLNGFVYADHYESLMLDGFESSNVRGLIDIADRIATKIASGTDPVLAIDAVFLNRFSIQCFEVPDGEMDISDRITQKIILAEKTIK